jgi:hypothetical protein
MLPLRAIVELSLRRLEHIRDVVRFVKWRAAAAAFHGSNVRLNVTRCMTLSAKTSMRVGVPSDFQHCGVGIRIVRSCRMVANH